MRGLAVAIVALLAGCGAPIPRADETGPNSAASKPAGVPVIPDETATPSGPGWQGAASGEGDALFLADSDDARILTLFCPADSSDLVVNVPAFSPIGSEERMSFGAGDTVVALVADPSGDPGRGGVTGRGPLPAELPAILAAADGISVSYGSQTSGPHAAPASDLARAFLADCRD